MGNLTAKLFLLGTFCVYLAKSLILGSNLNEVLIIGILGALTAYYEFKSDNKKLEEIETQLKALNQAKVDQDKIIDDIKSSIASVKINTGFRTITNGK